MAIRRSINDGVNKFCTHCETMKPLDEFPGDCSKFDQKSSYCKKCLSLKSKKYIIENRELVKERNRLYRLKNIEKIKQIKKLYSIKYREQIKIRNHLKYLKNKEKYKITADLYRQKKRLLLNKKNVERSKVDIQYRLRCNLRKRLGKYVKGTTKHGSSVRDLGCTVKELIVYLESRFSEGMTWENYGYKKGIKTWHIDHIIPLTKFDLTQREELIKACHYTNLQPMWGDENIRKSNKIIT